MDCSFELYLSSLYNFVVPTDEAFLLYNSASGVVIELSGRDAQRAATELTGKPRPVALDSFDHSLRQQLTNGGFVIQSSVDEVAVIRERFRLAVSRSPVVLTVTTTMDCNLGCYYCYEERSTDQLQVRQISQILELARNLLSRDKRDSLHVDWYGGEPLMNLTFLDQCSLALQELCRKLGILYSASVISNGTCWPSNVEEFVSKHKVRQVQISFDGMRAHHNKRRRYRNEYSHKGVSSSFDIAVDLVDKLVHCVRVDVRFNIDRKNREDVLPFLAFARARGWFSGRHPARFQPARVSAYTKHSAFMRKAELSIEEYEEIRKSVREQAQQGVVVEEAEVPDKFPHPRTTVCAALARDSFVVGADSRLYRCGLQVGERERSVGALGASGSALLPILNERSSAGDSDEKWWNDFDPTQLETCSHCSFLPVCWGGCPKKHLEGDRRALLEQGAYWRLNLPRLIAEGVGRNYQAGFCFSETDQFRVP